MEYDIVGWIFGILHVFTIMWIIAGNVIHFVLSVSKLRKNVIIDTAIGDISVKNMMTRKNFLTLE